MIRNYLKVAWRNLLRDKRFSLINIGGLAIGMTVAMLIGLWMRDELSFDHYHENHGRIVQIMQHQQMNGNVMTSGSVPIPLGPVLQADYKSFFKHIILTRANDCFLAAGDRKVSTIGLYMQPEGPEMLTLRMLHGSRNALTDPSAILLSASQARALFGNTASAMHQLLRINNKFAVHVAGVYEDLPDNTSFSPYAGFFGAWDLYVTTEPYIKSNFNNWGNNSWQVFAELNPNVDLATVNKAIVDVRKKGLTITNDLGGLKLSPRLFAYPMDRWHLYSNFVDGKETGGPIQFVWMFGLVGLFILLLACINFMNLSTARSERRAREVGVRKAIGSARSQLVAQFFAESILMALLAFFLSVILLALALPLFSDIAGRQTQLSLFSPSYWLAGLAFAFVTGAIAGSYPALYLSSFNPVKTLKGTFRVGPNAALPRKILVVAQFFISGVLIIGTMVVFMQVRYSKDRPTGYDQRGLVVMQLKNHNIHEHFEAFRQDLLSSGAMASVAESDSPPTEIWSNYTDPQWVGKSPDQEIDFGMIKVSHDYGHTVGWQIQEGRDFSRDLATDSTAMVINRSAAKYMGMQHPVGQFVDWGGRHYQIIGVVNDLLMTSPFAQAEPSMFSILRGAGDVINIRISPQSSTNRAMEQLRQIYARYDPDGLFDYTFTDREYGRKFEVEERVGKLSGVFTALAIFISCLGLFGMATFAAEQRRKEIGVRKVLGASVAGLWRLMSAEFVVLVVIALVLAMPVAAYVMQRWLQQYDYRVHLHWWLFAGTGFGAIFITLLTVSYQTIRAALANPVKSLRSE